MSSYETNRYSFPASAIASGILADARIPDLAAAKITSGTFADSRLAASNVTQHVSTAPTTGTWSFALDTNTGSIHNVTTKYQKIGQICYCQAEFQVQVLPSTGGAHRLKRVRFTGLPFTSFNPGSTWYIGGHMQVYGSNGTSLMSGSNGLVFAEHNSTNLHLARNGGTSQLTANGATTENLFFREHDLAGLFGSVGNWLYLSFFYMTAS
tara:strand:- start:97 stop:723 length:627 start_codon:yes stop_codon:yes gene_type:complete